MSTSEKIVEPTYEPMSEAFLFLTDLWTPLWRLISASTSLRINLSLSWRSGVVSWSLEEPSP